MGERERGRTDLSPDKLGQRADELRRGVAAEAERLGVDDGADVQPEGGFETLRGLSEADVLKGAQGSRGGCNGALRS